MTGRRAPHLWRFIRPTVLPGSTRAPVSIADLQTTYADDAEIYPIPTPDGATLAMLRRAGREDRPSLLFLNGNAMTLMDSTGIAADLGAMGNTLYMVDYPGFGASGGEATEQTLRSAVEAAFDHIAAREGGTRVVVIGWSLGSVLAMAVAAARPAAGLVLLSPLLSVGAAALDQFGIGRLARGRRGPFAGLRYAGRVTCPALILTGADDELTPPWMGERLQNRLAGPTEIHCLPGVDHGSMARSSDAIGLTLTFADGPKS